MFGISHGSVGLYIDIFWEVEMDLGAIKERNYKEMKDIVFIELFFGLRILHQNGLGIISIWSLLIPEKKQILMIPVIYFFDYILYAPYIIA